MDTLIALANGSLTRATREGEEWTTERSKITRRITCITSSSSPNGPIYAGTDTGSILASADKGATWRTMGSVGKEVKSIAIAPSNPAILYAGTKPARVFASEDSGTSWVESVEFRKIPWRWLWISPAEAPYVAYVQGLAVSPADPEVVLAGIEYGAVVRSEDGGLTWQGHRKGVVRDCHNIIFHPRDGSWAYEAGGSGAAFSADGGMTWNQPRAGLDRRYCWAVAANLANPAEWYVSASPGAFKAHGKGKAQAYVYRMGEDEKWVKLGGGLQQPLDHMPYALLTNPSNQHELYAGVSNGEVWFSGDRGDTWERLPVNLGSIERMMIAI